MSTTLVTATHDAVIPGRRKNIDSKADAADAARGKDFGESGIVEKLRMRVDNRDDLRAAK